MHPLAHDVLRAAQAERDLGISPLLDQTSHQRCPCRRGELFECSRQGAVSPVGAFLDALQLGIIETYRLHAETASSCVGDAVAAEALAQLVTRDSEEPCHGRGVAPVGTGAHHDGRERLGGEIERELAIADPSLEEGDDGVEVLALERRERIVVAGRDAPQQSRVIRV
jgi:hypothetical protein